MKEKNRKGKKNNLPENFKTVEEFCDFWDTHSLTDFEEHLKEIPMSVNVKRKHYYVSVTPEILNKMKKLSEKEGVSIKTLTNGWLKEKLRKTRLAV